MLLKVSLLLSFLFPPTLALGATWVDWSRRLTLDSKKIPRTLVLKKLKAIKNLSSQLQEGLDTPEQRAYALDVIAALEKKDFIETLKNLAADDPDGYSILTLNTLLDSTSYRTVAEAYKKILEDRLEEISPAAALALVDSLSRWGTELDLGTLDGLLGHSYPEVRLAALDYMRVMVVKFRKRQYLNRMAKLMTLKPYQVRLRALYLFDELPGGRARLKLIKNCSDDESGIVRRKCRQYREKWEAL